MTKYSNIPAFKTIQEEAAFWDTHDFTDFLDEAKPVKVQISPNLSHILPVRFDDQTLNDLEMEANRKGLATGTLIRMLVKERLYDRGSSRGAIKTA